MTEHKNLFTTQNVRLIDVFVVAPFLIYTSTLKGNPNWVRLSLFLLGASTLVYNGYNYLNDKKDV
jgi:hypothetical protein